jgi:ComF family protein
MLGILRPLLQYTWQHALATVLPPTCVHCHTPLPATEPMALCPTCYAQLPWWNTAQVLPPPLPPALASYAAPCLYAEPLKTLLLALKFQDATHLATPLARLLRPCVPAPITVIIGVPSHRTRLQRRRYNHAVLLARALARATGLPHQPGWLKRTHPGTPQQSRTRAQRLRLPSTHFWASPKLKGHHVLLLDDIRTTGATLRACALALKKAGAASVHGCTVAYTTGR